MDVMEMTRKTDLTTHMDMTCKVDNMTNLVDMTNRTDMTTRMDMTCRADVTSRMDVTCRPDMSFDALPSPGSNEDASPLMDMTCKNTRYFFFFFETRSFIQYFVRNDQGQRSAYREVSEKWPVKLWILNCSNAVVLFRVMANINTIRCLFYVLIELQRWEFIKERF